MKPLKVLARGGVLVQQYEALGSSQRRWIGRKHEAVTGVHNVQSRWPAVAEPVTVPTVPEGHEEYANFWQHYAKNVRKGELWAADEATAKACGVDFDPKYGGEFDAGVVVKASEQP